MLHNRMTTAFERSKEQEHEAAKNEIPSFQVFIERRDFLGAITVLKFLKSTRNTAEVGNADLWIAYCNFHLGRHEEALEIYTALKKSKNPLLMLTPSISTVPSACCIWARWATHVSWQLRCPYASF